MQEICRTAWWCPTLSEWPVVQTIPSMSIRDRSDRPPVPVSARAFALLRLGSVTSGHTSKSWSCTASGRSSPHEPASPLLNRYVFRVFRALRPRSVAF
jgi:hypothetical protein